MVLPKSIFELITDDVIETIAGIQRAAGRTFDVEVEEEDKANIPVDGKVVIGISDPEPRDRPAMQHDEWTCPYSIKAFFGVTGEDEDDTLNSRGSALFAELMREIMDDPYRGNYAINTYVRTPRIVKATNEMPCVQFNIDVWTRHLKDNPFEI